MKNEASPMGMVNGYPHMKSISCWFFP